MTYELTRRLRFLASALVAIGQPDNARALERRIADGTAAEWLHTELGEHVWAEITGGLCTARAIGPSHLAKLVKNADHARGEAEALLAERRVPALRVIEGGASPSTPPKRAA